MYRQGRFDSNPADRPFFLKLDSDPRFWRVFTRFDQSMGFRVPT